MPIWPISTRVFSIRWIGLYTFLAASLSFSDAQAEDFAGAYLDDEDLRHAWFVDENFSGSSLVRADLSYATLNGSDLSDAFLEEADLSFAALRRVDFRNAFLDQALLLDADLTDANLRGSLLYGADFSGANLSGVDFAYSKWSDGFSYAAWAWADNPPRGLPPGLVVLCDIVDRPVYEDEQSRGVPITCVTNVDGGREFEGSRLDLSGQFLDGEDFRHKPLSGVDLSSAFLDRADLSFANLRNADLRHSFLEETRFRSADLTEADFRNAFLFGTELVGANLSGADFSGAEWGAEFPQGAWAWQSRPPRGIPDGSVVLCQDSLRRQYQERNIRGIPLGCVQQ